MSENKKILQAVMAFIRKETVLSVAAVLAVLSMAVIPPDRGYLSYIDLRTLGLLFALMTVVGGVKRRGVFTALAGALTARASAVEIRMIWAALTAPFPKTARFSTLNST